MNTPPDVPSTHDYATLISSFAQAWWETNAEGAIRTDSPAWRAYTGQSRDLYMGEGWLAAIHPDDRHDARQQWQQALTGPHLLNGVWRLQQPNGNGWRWVNILAAPVMAPDGSVEKWLGLNIDISDRKQAAWASHDHSDGLDGQSASLHHRSEQIRAISHDLKGSFGIVNGALSLLELTDSETERVQYIDMALRNVRQATSLLNELLNLTWLDLSTAGRAGNNPTSLEKPSATGL